MRLLICYFLFLTGCATYQWVKPGATSFEGRDAISNCDIESHIKFPVHLTNVMVYRGEYGPVANQSTKQQTTCKTTYYGELVCETEPSPYQSTKMEYRQVPVTVTVDANEDIRDTYFNQCMNGRGFYKERVK